MPKVYLSKQDKLKDKLVTLIYGTMKIRNVTQKRMADRLGISQPAFGKKLKHKQFTHTDLVEIFDELEFQDEEILSVLREQ